MRKFITNGALISAIFGVVGVIRQTSAEQRKWRIVLLWLAWGIGVATAVAGVLDAHDDARERELKS